MLTIYIPPITMMWRSPRIRRSHSGPEVAEEHDVKGVVVEEGEIGGMAGFKGFSGGKVGTMLGLVQSSIKPLNRRDINTL